MDVTGANVEYIEQLRLDSVVSGYVNETGQLVLVKGDESEINAGQVVQGINEIWPIGSIYTSISPANPSIALNGGTWIRFGEGKVLVSQDSTQVEFDTVEETGGAKTHTLTAAQIPEHQHGYNQSNYGLEVAGGSGQFLDSFNSFANTFTAVGGGVAPGGQPHNNLQPYIVVYMWKRTA